MEIQSFSPINSRLLGKIKTTSVEDYEYIIEKAEEAFLHFRKIPAPKRGDLIRQFGNKLREKKDNLGKLVSIEMGLFSYPILMAADILMFDSTHVPVGSDQIQHLEMTRDIAARFNHLFKPLLTLPEPIIQEKEEVVLGTDGKKMSKSYGNVIPLLEDEKVLKKSIMKIVTNSLEPGEPKDSKNCTVFDLYKYFATESEINTFQKSYDNGISWGEAKEILFDSINKELQPIRTKYEELSENKDHINDLLSDGAKKARIIAKEKILQIREAVGLTKIS